MLLIVAKITDFAPTNEGGPNAFVLMDTKEITVREVGAELFLQLNALHSSIIQKYSIYSS